MTVTVAEPCNRSRVCSSVSVSAVTTQAQAGTVTVTVTVPTRVVCVCLLLQYLIQSCARGGRRIVEDMCYEIRRAEACVD
jgi:hypothetical protein